MFSTCLPHVHRISTACLQPVYRTSKGGPLLSTTRLQHVYHMSFAHMLAAHSLHGYRNCGACFQPAHHVSTACLSGVCCMSTACPLHFYHMYIACLPHAYHMYLSCLPHVSIMPAACISQSYLFTPCPPHVHHLYLQHTHHMSIASLSAACLLHVYCMSTACLLHVCGISTARLLHDHCKNACLAYAYPMPTACLPQVYTSKSMPVTCLSCLYCMSTAYLLHRIPPTCLQMSATCLLRLLCKLTPHLRHVYRRSVACLQARVMHVQCSKCRMESQGQYQRLQGLCCWVSKSRRTPTKSAKDANTYQVC